MKENGISMKILYFMLIIYLIGALQFVFRETKVILDLFPLSYGQKVDFLDGPFYRNVYYKYYAWLDQLLPKNRSFSILYDDASKEIYTRYLRKMHYYFYPRHLLLNGVDLYAYHKKGSSLLSKMIYPEFVLALKKESVPFKNPFGIKYAVLNHRPYFAVSALDDKTLLVEKRYLLEHFPSLAGTFKAPFNSMYGIKLRKGLF